MSAWFNHALLWFYPSYLALFIGIVSGVSQTIETVKTKSNASSDAPSLVFIDYSLHHFNASHHTRVNIESSHLIGISSIKLEVISF
jgi:hypothetical protein